MEINQAKGIIEAILFAAGREVKIGELMSALELSSSEIITIIESMKTDYQKETRGLQIVNIGEAYQLCTKQEYYEYLYTIFDKRNKPNLSQAALETLAIIAYNPRITRAEIEAIRGVNSDGTIYKLLDYNLIEETGKLDAPGRPGTYGITSEFLRVFGIGNLEELPDLPRYKLDENQQIVIDDIIEENKEEQLEATQAVEENKETEKEVHKDQAIKEESVQEVQEAPMTEREESNKKPNNQKEGEKNE